MNNNPKNIETKIDGKLKASVSLKELFTEDPENAEELINEKTVERTRESDTEDNQGDGEVSQV